MNSDENEIISSITSNRNVVFSKESKNDLKTLESTFKFYKSSEEIEEAIVEILKCDQSRRKLSIEYKCQFDSIISFFQYESENRIVIKSIKAK